MVNQVLTFQEVRYHNITCYLQLSSGNLPFGDKNLSQVMDRCQINLKVIVLRLLRLGLDH